ncbi:MAG: hypothetical protein A3C90_04730 [Candidatus Magasanikbacteria bacterium RIFCSPHIGHO2_02_FULL_51_14]|uniref:Methyltransferase domain-containing protein n=1 Tax=Candidatus Magasanikbacteria bacterium RIFCSPHIGHO2_02_FULL_51_14 TaxID=1798683 RepID=A0A1F6MQB8_9BACT|nr:MAG: hypothetical protein A3C90_04730 [Candidatus Magasanikbacteria bacterium RIFCSPHIGHO2_02_FULL_51_14]
MVELIVEMIFAVLVIALDVVIVMHLLRGAPYLPTHRESVAKMIELAQVRPADKMVDLGSGDGRIVIAFAKQGIEAHGYEVNPLLVWWSRKNIQRAGLDGRAFIHRQSFWRADFSSYSIVTIFGITHIMKGLEKKLQKELAPGARVISNAFRFPNWKLNEKKGAVMLFELTDNG